MRYRGLPRLLQNSIFTNTVSGSSTSMSFLSSTPIVTKSIIGLNILIHVTIFLTNLGLQQVAINGHLVINQMEVYRIITSAFTHASLMHIGMNMMSMYQLGTSLEIQFGSLSFLFLSIWSVVIIGLIYVLIAYLAWCITGDYGWMLMSGVGYSGVLFCYAILESFHTTAESISLFGFCNVPAKWYPFVLLLLIQFLIPGISFIGHVSGVLFGLMIVYGLATKFILPSNDFIEYLESTQFCSCFYRIESYVRNTGRSYTVPSLYDNGGICSSICYTFATIYKFIVDACLTVLAIIGCPSESIAERCRQWTTPYTDFINRITDSYFGNHDRSPSSSPNISNSNENTSSDDIEANDGNVNGDHNSTSSTFSAVRSLLTGAPQNYTAVPTEELDTSNRGTTGDTPPTEQGVQMQTINGDSAQMPKGSQGRKLESSGNPNITPREAALLAAEKRKKGKK